MESALTGLLKDGLSGLLSPLKKKKITIFCLLVSLFVWFGFCIHLDISARTCIRKALLSEPCSEAGNLIALTSGCISVLPFTQ